MHVVIQIQGVRRKFKNFANASEIKSYQGYLQKHKLQEMITQFACNKPTKVARTNFFKYSFFS